MSYLIVGGDSLIGATLAKELRRAGKCVLSTTRRQHETSHDKIQLDLTRPPETWRLPDSIETAYLCAAVTSVDECERNPHLTHDINVTATSALVGALSARGAKIVFLSTSHVFHGSIERPSISTPIHPKNEYGRQKAEIERLILSCRPASAVVRATKVFSGWPLLSRWRESLDKGEAVNACDDMVVSPVPLALVAAGLLEIGVTGAMGCHHFSGPKDVTYFELAKELARQMAKSTDLVRPVSADSLGIPDYMVVDHSALDSSASERQLGLSFPSIDACNLAECATSA